MGVHILYDPSEGAAVLWCSTTDWAFGPVIRDNEFGDGVSAVELAEEFLAWLGEQPRPDQEYIPIGVLWHGDPRDLTDRGLEKMYTDWCIARRKA